MASKHRARRLFLSGLALISLLGCNFPISLAAPTARPGEQAAPTAAGFTPGPGQTALPPLPTIAPAPEQATLTPPDPQRPRYDLQVALFPNSRQAEVSERIIYTNRHSAALSELVLVAPPNRYADAFTLRSIRWAGGEGEASYRLSGPLLTVSLPQPLETGGTVGLQLDYQLILPAASGAFGSTPRQLNFGDWYPFVAAISPEGTWLAFPPAPLGEYSVNDLSDFKVSVDVRQEGGWQLAGSAIPRQQGSLYTFELTNARSFSWSAGLEMVTLVQQFGDVTLSAFVFAEHSAAGEMALYHMSRAIEVFSDLYTPYAHPSLTLIEATMGDGMEYDGMFFLSSNFFADYQQGIIANNLMVLTVHETAHQWWYARVGSDPYNEPWLDEALCTYSELLFMERIYPDLVNWWWQFRVNYFGPAGYVNLPVNAYGSFRQYVNAVYLNGANFLEELRYRAGDEGFRRFLKEYARRYDGRRATAADFRALLEEINPADYSDIYQRYFR